MKKIVYVTGNAHKSEYFAKIMGMDIKQMKVDVDEIQSLNLREVVKHKAYQAFELAKRPVIVEDTKMTFNALGALPGPFIKWFLDELGAEGLCKLLDGYSDRSAIAGAAIAYYDGSTLEIFEKELAGKISNKPEGTDGFGWNKIFIPEGSDMTLAEMDEVLFTNYYHKIKAFKELKKFLDTL
jgi:inosine triphosphate pyrophosphatase